MKLLFKFLALIPNIILIGMLAFCIFMILSLVFTDNAIKLVALIEEIFEKYAENSAVLNIKRR